MTLAKWFVYTVLLALTPILMRLLVVGLSTSIAPIRWLNETDVITFGLILAITNISGLEGDTKSDRDWKSKQVGVSLLNVAAFATLFAVSLFAEIAPANVSRGRLLAVSVFLAAGCAIHSYSIWERLAAIRTRSRVA